MGMRSRIAASSPVKPPVARALLALVPFVALSATAGVAYAGEMLPTAGDDTNLVLPIVAGVVGALAIAAAVIVLVVRRKRK